MPSIPGYWIPAENDVPESGAAGMLAALERCHEPAWVVGGLDGDASRLGVAFGGHVSASPVPGSYPLHALLPPVHAEWLGDRTFCEEHGTRFAYVTGAMATGIASVELVCAPAARGFLAFYGAGGLSLERVERDLDTIIDRLSDRPDAAWGSNLIHSPDQPALEDALVDAFLLRGVSRIEASAFMSLSPAIVRYAATGLALRHLRTDSSPEPGDGEDQPARSGAPFPAAASAGAPGRARRGRRHHRRGSAAGRASAGRRRCDVRGRFGRAHGSPPVDGAATRHPSSCATSSPLPEGGRGPCASARRAAWATLPRLRPPSRWAPDYVVTGSVNQVAIESGTSDAARAMLALAGLADVTMAPAADMFELGIEVQVLRRGTLFAQRAKRLYELYREYPSLDALPAETRQKLEREILRASVDEIWRECEVFWSGREPAQLERAARDPHHRMALVFRWYLGNSNRWAREGAPNRQTGLSNLVWAGHGRVQRLGGGHSPR